MRIPGTEDATLSLIFRNRATLCGELLINFVMSRVSDKALLRQSHFLTVSLMARSRVWHAVCNKIHNSMMSHCKLRTSHCKLRTSHCKLRMSHCKAIIIIIINGCVLWEWFTGLLRYNGL